MMRNMFAKNYGRGTRDLSISSSLASTMKRVWEDQKDTWILLAFTGGFVTHAYTNFQIRKKRWYEVDAMFQEYEQRSDATSERNRGYSKGIFDDPPQSTS